MLRRRSSPRSAVITRCWINTPEILALQSEFAKALREGPLSVAYHPKVRLADGGLIGLEALARWTHPTMGPIAPS